MTCHERAQPILAGACKKRSIKQDHQDQCDVSQRNAIGPRCSGQPSTAAADRQSFWLDRAVAGSSWRLHPTLAKPPRGVGSTGLSWGLSLTFSGCLAAFSRCLIAGLPGRLSLTWLSWQLWTSDIPTPRRRCRRGRAVVGRLHTSQGRNRCGAGLDECLRLGGSWSLGNRLTDTGNVRKAVVSPYPFFQGLAFGNVGLRGSPARLAMLGHLPDVGLQLRQLLLVCRVLLF
mmetsp:Transcript_55832/g.130888  ORF Transcript_55832/g.130888 Transcript_55832/m.130888 type:complete len:230 (-) Transcript_55832:871-1560(-)